MRCEGGVFKMPVRKPWNALRLHALARGPFLGRDLAWLAGTSSSDADWDVVEIERLRRGRQGALEIRVSGLAPHRICQIAREMTPAGAIATVDAGAHMFPAAEYWQAVEPGEFLISNGLATMGFALQLPTNHSEVRVVYEVRKASQQDQVIVTDDGEL